MSQIVTRKGPVNDDKEKRQTDSPVKDMKKKVAANAEKEKQADKPAEKPAEKPADKPADKKDKPLDKAVEKKNEKRDSKGAEKPVEQKAEKAAEKKTADKQVEKKDDVQKPKDDSRGEKSDKADKPEDKKKPEPKPKQNGQEPTHNGTVQSNGNKENGTVSSDDEDHNDLLVIEEQDEMFPELAYDDGSDVEVFEPPTPESVPSRSLTRRSQAKVMRTPETPRPASDKPDALPADDSKEPKDSKGLKPKEDPPARNLRSSDSPKSLEKREGKEENEKAEGKSQELSAEKIETDIVIDVEAIDDVERRKTDTNFSKSRVKVSPYRRSVRLDNTTSSMAANYTGNNTTLEMDVTESFTEDTSLNDSYLAGLKQIRSRLTHQPLKDMQMRRLVASRTLAAASSVSLSEQGRPTVTVVGRKRKPESESTSVSSEPIAGKRARIFDRISLPFRRVATQAAPEIVGVNTDLPLTAPIVATETFDPETIKQSIPLAPVVSAPVQERERKCIIM